MNPRFVVNDKGKVTAVQVALKDWQELERKAQAYDRANSIQNGLKEVALIENKVIKPKSFIDLLNEI